ncbi:MAG: hypothetical protein IT212_07515 [Bacteroidia bacterium]|nr:hypothetical protein [Bacteroidia bacterium]
MKTVALAVFVFTFASCGLIVKKEDAQVVDSLAVVASDTTSTVVDTTKADTLNINPINLK